MLKYNLILALRAIWNKKLDGGISILSLSLAFGVSILILLYIQDEWTFDRFHTNVDRIYRPWYAADRGDERVTNVMIPFVAGEQLEASFEEIETYTIHTQIGSFIRSGENEFEETVTIVSPSFLSMFTFPAIAGDAQQALRLPGNAVLTEEMAIKYFGNPNVVGNTFQINLGGRLTDFQVASVVENIPSNSSLRFDILIPDHHLESIFPPMALDSWNMIVGEVYIMLKEGASVEAINLKMPDFIASSVPEEERAGMIMRLQPLERIHLDNDLPQGLVPVSDPRYIFILSGIALMILVIASLNFTSISIGRSLSRAKEIGVRKSLGASRWQLFSQFEFEALLMTVFSLVSGILIAFLFLSHFNELAGKSLPFHLDPWNLAIYLMIAILVGILAGSYPSIVLSGFDPVATLKGRVSKSVGRKNMRMVLVGIQFILSIFLISSTVIMKDQLRYLQHKNLGFEQEQVISISINVENARGMMDMLEKGMEKGQVFQNELATVPGVQSTALTSHSFEPGTWTRVGFFDQNDQMKEFYFNTISPGYVNTLGIKLAEGRKLEAGNQADETQSVLVNQAFVEYFGMENPLGNRIEEGEFTSHRIVGVVEDFHIESLHAPIGPLMLAVNPRIGFSGAESVNVNSSPNPKVLVKLEGGNVQATLATIRSSWNKIYGNEPFDYHFIDDRLEDQYRSEQNLGKIVTSSGILAVMIACLGLFGLASITLAGRIKEVSIRKIMGASMISLLGLLSRGFLFIIILATLISVPVTWFFMRDWLTGFSYRIHISPAHFLLAGGLTLVVAILVISRECLKTASGNPAEQLRSE